MIASSRSRALPASPQTRQRQALDEVRERKHQRPERLHDAGERVADLARLRRDVGVEQRLADDRQREAIHLLRHVDRRPVRPRLALPIRVLHHRRRVFRDAIAMKRRLHQPPLPQMHGAFARQQPLAEHALRPLEPAALREVLVVRHQDVLDDARIADDEHVLAAEPDVREIAVCASDVLEELERIAARSIDRATSGARPSAREGILSRQSPVVSLQS